MSQQYKVPQNIDLEDKVVGPFTMKQFGYLMAGGGLIYAIYSAYGPYENGILYTVLWSIPIAFLSISLTFIKVNDRPFEFFLLNLAGYLFTPKKRIWQQGYRSSKVVLMAQEAIQTMKPDGAAKRASLDDIASHLELYATNTAAPAGQPQIPNPNPPAGGQAPNNGGASGMDQRLTSDTLTSNSVQGIAPQMASVEDGQVSSGKYQVASANNSVSVAPNSQPLTPDHYGVLDAVFGIFKKKPKQRLAKISQTDGQSQAPNSKLQTPNNSGGINSSQPTQTASNNNTPSSTGGPQFVSFAKTAEGAPTPNQTPQYTHF